MSKFGRTLKYLINRAPQRLKLELHLIGSWNCTSWKCISTSSHSFPIALNLRQDTDALGTSKGRSLRYLGHMEALGM